MPTVEALDFREGDPPPLTGEARPILRLARKTWFTRYRAAIRKPANTGSLQTE